MHVVVSQSVGLGIESNSFERAAGVWHMSTWMETCSFQMHSVQVSEQSRATQATDMKPAHNTVRRRARNLLPTASMSE